MDELVRKAALAIMGSVNCIALTGAGISVESGIPDFRSAGGLWSKYDPMEYAHITAFQRNPEKIWRMIFDLLDLTRSARPNPAHQALAALECMNYLKSIVTQNLDNLHQAAGNENVIEFHGNAHRLECLECGAQYDINDFELAGVPPACRSCGTILKPSVVFFGEMIPHDALVNAQILAQNADAILVIGTSAVVYPASGIPYIARDHGAVVIEMNIEETELTGSITDIFIQGPVGETLPALLSMIEMESKKKS